MICSTKGRENEDNKVPRCHRKHCKKSARKRRRKGKSTHYRLPRSRWVYGTPKRSKDSNSNSARNGELNHRVAPPPTPCSKSTVGAYRLQPAFLQKDEKKIYMSCSEEQDFPKYELCKLDNLIYSLSLKEDGDEKKEEEKEEEEEQDAAMESPWNLEPMPILSPPKKKRSTRESHSHICKKLF